MNQPKKKTKIKRAVHNYTFFEHLAELRQRLLKSAVFFLVCVGLFSPLTDRTLSYVLKPVGKVVFLSPSEAFSAYWSAMLLGGFLFSLPYILYQIWGFISSGLNAEERQLMFVYGPLSVILFFLGAGFAFFVMIPISLSFLLSYATPQMVPMITLERYLSFIWSFILAFGITFELPLFLFVLARWGIVTPRMLVSGRRYAIIIIFIVAAILTPPDVASQVMLAVPMLVLYEAGVWLAGIGVRMRSEK